MGYSSLRGGDTGSAPALARTHDAAEPADLDGRLGSLSHRGAVRGRAGGTHVLRSLASSAGRATSVAVRAPGSDLGLRVGVRHRLPVPPAATRPRPDVAAPPARWLDEHHAYLDLMVASRGRAPTSSTSSTTTACTTCRSRWLRRAGPDREHAAHAADAVAGIRDPGRGTTAACTFAAVSAHTAAAWSHLSPTRRDPQRGRRGSLVPRPGRRPGRVVRADRAGEGPAPGDRRRRARGAPLRLAGPIADRAYFEREIAPRLASGRRVRGASDQAELARLVGSRAVALVTPAGTSPTGWSSPRRSRAGHPCARSRAARCRSCTPSRAPRRPGTSAGCGGDRRVRGALDAAARRHAVRECSLERMVDRYVASTARWPARGVIGYYVHHSGRRAPHPGRGDRAGSAERGLRPALARARRLARRVGAARARRRAPEAVDRRGGNLHWAPNGTTALPTDGRSLGVDGDRTPRRPRQRRVGGGGVLVRLHGVPVVSVVLPGRRGDRAHRSAYAVSSGLVAAWPRSDAGLVHGLARRRRRLHHVGALSRLETAGPDQRTPVVAGSWSCPAVAAATPRGPRSEPPRPTHPAGPGRCWAARGSGGTTLPPPSTRPRSS